MNNLTKINMENPFKKTEKAPVDEANKIKQEYVDLRQKQRVECDKEITAVLKKYGFDLSAEITTGERGIIPSILLKDIL